MAKTVLVHCPFCPGSMEVDVESGKIVEKWDGDAAGNEDGDKMASALKKLEDAKKKRKGLFESTKGEIEGQKKKISSDFAKEVEKIKKEGLKDKPLRPFDLD